MKQKVFLEVVLYLGLLVGCLIFVAKSIDEYMSGFTSYSISHAPIFMTDLPTVSFCIESDWLFGADEWKYGSHFSLEVQKIRKARTAENKCGSRTTEVVKHG